MEPSEKIQRPARASLVLETSAKFVRRAVPNGTGRRPAGTGIGVGATGDPARREVLTGLSRVRIDIAFIGQLLNEAGEAHTMRTVAAVLERVDEMIAHLSEESHGSSLAPVSAIVKFPILEGLAIT
jgi:hypothetical protein